MSEMTNDLVRYSRAGDAFHYRWAARRCLKMIYPSSRVRYIVIEGSKERKLAGEYVIDVSEYIAKQENNDTAEINYFQLKHTIVQKDEPFKLSDIKDTIVGFAKRYNEHLKKKSKEKILFYLVTNRPISQNLKNNMLKLQKRKQCDKRFQSVISEYTGLSGKRLADFCNVFVFMDEMGDYDDQMMELRTEVSHLLAGSIDHPQIDSITALVGESALPKSDGIIYPEDILKRFGCSSARDMYPAPAEYEKSNDIILTKQQNELTKAILESQEATIIHAAGGVGKSVFAREIPHFLTNNSIAIIYDCFGAGKYRNRSQPRHRYRDGIVQITNELAVQGFCDPLIIQSNALDDDILRKFLNRLNTAIKNLKAINDRAHIIIVIDAADNAEMAAKEVGENCFAHELLREKLPVDCHLVMLCRTERIELLQPDSSVRRYEMLPFSERETLSFLQKKYFNVTDADGLEFHRLTSGNPRVQANALDARYEHVSEMLEGLGPGGITVEMQIESQLDKAIEKVKDKLPHCYQKQIDAICCGLATLPPFIPLSILATAAEVDESEVKSFVAELGRPIWIAESVVQFRDEPTETWFRKRFSGEKQQVASYIQLLKPFANRFTYVAEVLPVLYHQAELYSELIELALSENLLPQDNPIDKRNVKIFRFQFAFKAALMIKEYGDAVKIAMLAGEEMAGDKRQLEIFKKNVDLIAPLQNKQKVQELAFKRVISGTWEGSENIFTASLLSSVSEFHGEARAYLRSASNWLAIYFRERDKKEDHFHEQLEKDEIAELAFAQYNLSGANKAVDFLLSWKPPEVIYNVACIFIRKMIDLCYMDSIEKIAELGSKSTFLILALSYELLKVGKYLNSNVLEHSLDELAKGKHKMLRLEDSFRETILIAIVSFAEICAAYGLPNEKISQLLDNYFPYRAPITLDSNYKNEVRETFLRVTTLRKSINANFDMNIDSLLPGKFSNIKQDYQYQQDSREYREILGGLLPWYFCRIQVLLNKHGDLATAIQVAEKNSKGILNARYRSNDIMAFEISEVCVDILLFCDKDTKEQKYKFYAEYIRNSKHMRIDSRLRALRGANRLEHLTIIRNQLVEQARDSITSCDGYTEQIAEYYVDLSRATISIDKEDAAEYFNMAIETVSRFGDEIVSRWRAVASLGNQSCKDRFSSPELAYRFIRCAELIGVNVEREKYFDRNEAIKICTNLSSASGLAAISRWLDRNIGDFDSQFSVVAEEIVSNGFVVPTAAWGLAPFFEEASLPEFIATCLRKEILVEKRMAILDSAIDYLRLYDTPIRVWQNLKQLSDDLSIKSKKLEDICLFLDNNCKERTEKTSRENQIGNYEYYKISREELADIFLGLDFTCAKDINTALTKFHKTKDSYQNKDVFWGFLFDHVPQGEAVRFLEALVTIDQVNIYTIEEAFSRLPEFWMKKPSVQKVWPAIVRQIAKSSAFELLNLYNHERFQKALKIEDSARHLIYDGMIEGLSGQERLDTADEFFGFVTTIANLLEPELARDLLSFTLARFEIHMEDDFADGKWAQWLLPPDESCKAITGFMWSALGSPSSEIRWNATHCVKQLGDNGCQNEIDALIEWLEKDQVSSFGSIKFPFYNLHARLHLFIAFARLSIDKPELLQKHTSIFLHYALQDMPHILIQMFAAKTALAIQKAFPGSYDKNDLYLIGNVCRSPYPEKDVEDRYKTIQSYLHQVGKVNLDLDFYHGYDFDRYWFEPLGRIFGVSKKQIEELATMVIMDEWKISNDGSYQNDPRNDIWNSYKYENKTFHSHQEYPKVERYSFYLSYHAMYVVAARLLQNMPILKDTRWGEECAWDEWLKRFSLTMDNGLWLSDRRDSVPMKEPIWMQEKLSEEWLEHISDGNFLEALLLNDKGWINVHGSWEYGSEFFREEVYIASAMVSVKASLSLLGALSSCEDPGDFKLPDYQEEGMEFDEGPFHLKGWITNNDSIDGIDGLDKLSGHIRYPVYQIGEELSEKLDLQSDGQLRNWYMHGQTEPCLTCTSWSYEISNYNDVEQMKGLRLSATLEVLKKLCVKNKCELIIKVQIHRRIAENRHRQSNEKAYVSPKHKVYLFSQDGGLIDENGSVDIRKTTC